MKSPIVFVKSLSSATVPLATIALVLMALASNGGCTRSKALTLALPTSDWWTAAPFLTPTGVALVKESAQGLRVLEVASGLASKNAVVAGTADVGLAAATPLALAAANGEPLVILASYLRSAGIVGLLRPKGSINGTPPEEPIAYVASTISESFLYAFLDKAREGHPSSSSLPRLLEQRPPDIPAALTSGAARSAVVWEPFLTMAASQPNMQRDATPIPFEVNLYLVTRRSIYESRLPEITAFLKGVAASCDWLTNNPELARAELEKRFAFTPGFLAETFPQVSYGVGLDRRRAEAEILREARVAQQRGRMSSAPDLSPFFPGGVRP